MSGGIFNIYFSIYFKFFTIIVEYLYRGGWGEQGGRHVYTLRKIESVSHDVLGSCGRGTSLELEAKSRGHPLTG